MKMIAEGGNIFILKNGELVYTIDTVEKTVGSKEFNTWVSLEGLKWEEF